MYTSTIQSKKSSSQQRLLISQSQTVTSNQLAQEDTIDNKIKNQIKAAIPDITTSVIDALKAHGLIMPQVLDKQTTNVQEVVSTPSACAGSSQTPLRSENSTYQPFSLQQNNNTEISDEITANIP
jgi:SOS-response transcriptional repressor LexA